MALPNTTGIKFLYTFCVGEYDLNNPGSNIISITSERQGFERVNLTTTPLRETWRSVDVATWQEIIIETNDLTITPDTFSLLNHNLTELAIVQLQGSMTSDFTTPAFTLSFTWTKKHMTLLQDVGTNYPYYRIRILDPTNECGYVELGRIIAGESFTVTKNEDVTDNITIQPDDLAYKTKTEGFFRAFNQRVKVDKLQIRFKDLRTYASEDNTNYVGLLDMMDVVGETYPLLVIPDPFDLSFSQIWGVIDTLPPRNYGVNRFVDMNFTIQEIY